MTTVRRALLFAVAALALGSATVTAPTPASAAGCLAGTYCASLAVDVTGFGSGSWMTTDAAGNPDGVVSCYYAGALYPTTCSHKFEWDRTSTRIVYWKAQPSPNSKVDLATGSLTLTSGQTTHAATAFDFIVAEQVRVSRSGGGTVTSSPPGLSCGSTCLWVFDAGPHTPISVTVTPDPGWTFAAWYAQGASCPPPPATTCAVPFGSIVNFSIVFEQASSAQPATPPVPTPVPTVAPTPTRATTAPASTPAATRKAGSKPGAPTTNLAGGAGDSSLSWPIALIALIGVLAGGLLWLARSRNRQGR